MSDLFFHKLLKSFYTSLDCADSDDRYTYSRFPAYFREVEEEKKRKQILKYIKDKNVRGFICSMLFNF